MFSGLRFKISVLWVRITLMQQYYQSGLLRHTLLKNEWFQRCSFCQMKAILSLDAICQRRNISAELTRLTALLEHILQAANNILQIPINDILLKNI